MNLTMKSLILSIIVQLLTKDRNILTSAAGGIPALSKCGKVHLTISAATNELELNWITECDTSEDTPDMVALYSQDPRTAGKPLQSINPRKFDGHFKTSIKYESPWLPGGWNYQENATKVIPGRHCLPFWIASIKKNRIIDSDCLKIQPTWMEDNRAVLGPQRIGSLLIPGTHNSGAHGWSTIFANKFMHNQHADIYTQLVFGIRYLDLRVGYYGDDGFYINHDLIQISRLVPHLRSIRHFADLAPKEVVIVDFHRFPYPTDFTRHIHDKLIAIIQEELGEHILPHSGLQVGKGPTLNEIWQHNKSLIICYGDRQMPKEYPSLWNPLQQYWGDKNKAGELKKYLYSVIKNHVSGSNPIWALMAELTLSLLDMILGSTSASFADEVNRKITKWFREEWFRDVNVVATDYFQGNDMINVAIEANKIR